MCAALRRWLRAGLKREPSWACFGGMLQGFVADKALRGWRKLTDLASSRAPKDLEIEESGGERDVGGAGARVIRDNGTGRRKAALAGEGPVEEYVHSQFS